MIRLSSSICATLSAFLVDPNLAPHDPLASHGLEPHYTNPFGHESLLISPSAQASPADSAARIGVTLTVSKIGGH